MDVYKFVGRVGEGAHGLVFRARNTTNGDDVALKKIRYKRLRRNSIPIQIFREIKNLEAVDCEYVVQLIDSFPQGLACTLVFEFMPSGLFEVLRDPQICLSETHIKAYMHMLLCGLSYLHDHNIMHRDLKPSNLVVDRKGVLKIADMGLSRSFSDGGRESYSHQVATRWYRAPELLYGSRNYDTGVDMWSVGCIFAEMYTNIPIFHGETDIEQLMIVLYILGTPTEERWPGMNDLPDFKKIAFPPSVGIPLEKIVPDANKTSLSIIKSLLQYNSKKRISAKEFLAHLYFFEVPRACPLRDMPRPGEGHRKFIPLPRDYEIHEPMYTLFGEFNNLLIYGGRVKCIF